MQIKVYMNLVSDVNLKCKHWLNLHVENEVQMWFEITSTIQIEFGKNGPPYSTKKCYVNKKNISHRNQRCAPKSCESQKNMLWQKKNMWHPKEDSYWLNMFSVAQKRNTYLQRMVPVVWSFIKKTDKRYIACQRMKTSDNEWYNEWQRMTTSGTKSSNEWQRVTTNDSEWQQMTKSGTRNKNGTVYFKEWMIAILSTTKIDTLLQRMDGWYYSG